MKRVPTSRGLRACHDLLLRPLRWVALGAAVAMCFASVPNVAYADETLSHRLFPVKLQDEPPVAGARELTDPPPQPPPADDIPVYKNFWFWVLTAAMVGGVITAGVVLDKPMPSKPHPCPMPMVTICFGDGRAR